MFYEDTFCVVMQQCLLLRLPVVIYLFHFLSSCYPSPVPSLSLSLLHLLLYLFLCVLPLRFNGNFHYSLITYYLQYQLELGNLVYFLCNNCAGCH